VCNLGEADVLFLEEAPHLPVQIKACDSGMAKFEKKMWLAFPQVMPEHLASPVERQAFGFSVE
jgi:hypothetical protein